MLMMTMPQAEDCVRSALRDAGASPDMAASTARALVLAEAQGLKPHGLSRVPQYISHLKNGRARGDAVPEIVKASGAAVVVDARQGLAFPACDLAVGEATRLARDLGISIAGVINSHHAGILADHLRPPAEAGLVGLAFANAPAVMAMPGGRQAVFGTNPVAAVFPRAAGAPLIVDLSLTEVTRGRLKEAADAGRPIPPGWALDRDGNPTTDAQAALSGTQLAVGAASGSKGAVLALLVELMASALIGAGFSRDASSFFVEEGNAPRIGQLFILIDPGFLAGRDSYLQRMEEFAQALLSDDGVRLPGAKRAERLERAMRDGINVPADIAAFR